ncbi:MAG: phosphoglycerate dehydrogenase [Planctomycetota bacterium]|jgi:D-3-phosphoglycerate dehydrogenase|nr:phosphoglycerate dehydrogenase [Planctomycetota bacterium]
MGKRVLITSGPLARAVEAGAGGMGEAFAILDAAGFEWIIMNKPDSEYRPEDFAGIMPGTQAVIAGGEPWGEELFRLSPDLRIIARFGAGYDAIDLAKAGEYGIMVTNAGVFELSNGVAELAVAMAISVYRELANGCEELRRGIWKGRNSRQLLGKTLGIIGFGRIGQRLAELLGGFRARLICHDPKADRERAAALGVEPLDFEPVLAQADIVFLCAPNLPETRRLFNAARFAEMKRGAVFINVARGALVDEPALLEALKSGHLSGAGLDVWETEPTPPGNPLLRLGNVLALPHLAGETEEGSIAIAKCCARQVVDAVAGRRPQHLLNPRPA